MFPPQWRGVVERMHVVKGDKVSKGTLIATVRTEDRKDHGRGAARDS